jgi:hypothetical protein
MTGDLESRIDERLVNRTRGEYNAAAAQSFEGDIVAGWLLDIVNTTDKLVRSVDGEDVVLITRMGDVRRQIKKTIASHWTPAAIRPYFQAVLDSSQAGDHTMFEFYTNASFSTDIVKPKVQLEAKGEARRGGVEKFTLCCRLSFRQLQVCHT